MTPPSKIALTFPADIDLIIGRLSYYSYFTKWNLKLNEAMTEAILFTRQRKPTQRTLTTAGHKVPWSDSVWDLGVIIDIKLNWSKHVANLRVKGAQAIRALNPILNHTSNLSPLTKLTIYSTLVCVCVCITYACSVWSSTCLTNHHILHLFQNKRFKIAFHTPYKTNLK